MEAPTVEARLAAWADLMSFVFLSLAILVGGLDPRRRVWGRSLIGNLVLTFFMAINIIFSAGRFIAEGVLVETGPREFLLISVLYSARWLWLFAGIARSGTRAAKAFKVARALRELKTIRFGTSTNAERRGQRELVIRRGQRVVKGEIYWRGVEEHVERIRSSNTYMVRLVEKELHSNLLDEIGTVDYKRKLETDSNDGLYKKFYDLVRTVDAMKPELAVDYGPFLEEFEAVEAETRQAQRVDATATDDLGKVARRVAADACYYIWHNGTGIEFRTPRHVAVINKCLEDAAMSHLGTDSFAAVV